MLLSIFAIFVTSRRVAINLSLRRTLLLQKENQHVQVVLPRSSFKGLLFTLASSLILSVPWATNIICLTSPDQKARPIHSMVEDPFYVTIL